MSAENQPSGQAPQPPQGGGATPEQGGGGGKILIPIIIIAVIVGFYFINQNKKKPGDTSKPAASGEATTPGSETTASEADYTLVSSSGAAMTAALEDAIKNKQWIVVTGWTPHWMFSRWKLKYLEDPEKVYGGAEEIRTITRKGLREEMPNVVKFLDAFEWTAADMEQVMVWNTAEGAKPEETARRWIKENDAKVEGWLKGIENRNLGKSLKMANVAWSSEIASSNVVKAVLEDKLGCECKITNTAAALMYESVGTGGQDFLVGAWLPSTQKDYYEKIKDKTDDLGPNMVGTKVGLVVPDYVTINSIEELAGAADKFKNKIVGIDAGAGIMGQTKTAIEKYDLKK